MKMLVDVDFFLKFELEALISENRWCRFPLIQRNTKEISHLNFRDAWSLTATWEFPLIPLFFFSYVGDFPTLFRALHDIY